MTLARNPGTGKEFVRYPQPAVQHRNLSVGVLADAWAGEAAISGPVAVRLTFRFKHLGSHYGTGRNSATLKPNAPTYVTTTPDIDKLCRLVLDALTIAGVIVDDSRVAVLRAEKVYHPTSETLVEVYEL